MGHSQSFVGNLHRAIIKKPDVLDMKGSYDYWSKVKLNDKTVTGMYVFADCAKESKEIKIEVKLNGTSTTYKLACDSGFYNSLGTKIYMPLGPMKYSEITELKFYFNGPILVRWSEIHFDKFYKQDFSGNSFLEVIEEYEEKAQEGLYVHSRMNNDEMDARMFAIRMLAAYPSLKALEALQNRFLYDGEFLDRNLRDFAIENSYAIYTQILKFTNEEFIADLLLQMHDFQEYSRPAHDVLLKVLNSLNSAAGLTYALITKVGYLPDPGLDTILNKKDAEFFINKQKTIILERVFSEFNTDLSLHNSACKVFTRFPQLGIFGTLFNFRENLFCQEALTKILQTKTIPDEIRPLISELKPMLKITYTDGPLTLALLAFMQVKTPEVIPMVKLVANSSKVRPETAILAKKVLESYAK